jgi:hypothetical protein
MDKVISILSLFLMVISLSTVSIADSGHRTQSFQADLSTHVRGYTRKDGTHVKAYERSKPDDKLQNNWSTKGNSNPHTSKLGTRIMAPKH